LVNLFLITMALFSNIKDLIIKIIVLSFGEGFFNEISSGLKKHFVNITWSFAGRIISSAIGFFAGILVVRFLGPSKYGLLSYVVSFVGLFSFIASLGIDSILYRDLIKFPEKRDQLLGTAFFLKLIGASFSILLMVVISLFLNNDIYTTLLVLIIGLSLLFQSFNVISSYFQSIVLSKFPVIVLLLTGVFLSIFKILLVLFGVPLIWFAVIFLLEGVITASGFVLIYFKNHFSIFDWKVNFSIGRELFMNAWPLIFSSAFALIYSRIDQVFIKHMLNDTAVGIYDAAVRLSEIWYLVPAIIAGSLFPAIVNAKKISEESYKNRIAKLYSLLIYLSFIMIIPLFILSDRVILLLYGNEFILSAAVIRIYVWTGVSASVGTVMNYYLINENFIKLSLLFNLVGMLSNVILNIIFIPLYGATGAALATLISYSLVPIVIFFFKKTRDHGFLILRAFMFK